MPGSPIKLKPIAEKNAGGESTTLVEKIEQISEQISVLIKKVDENNLSWRDDFFFFNAMSIPKKSQIFMRLNLNIPYYFFNYLQITFLVTIPLLLFLNIPFLIVLVSNFLCVYGILQDSWTKDQKHRGTLTCFGFNIRVSQCFHAFLLLWLVVAFFFNGLRTAFYVAVLNALLIIPHALVRNPTFFDDEEMEKLRPKLINYVLMFVFVTLLYLEGDITGPEDENLRRSEEERERIKSFLQR